MREAVAALPAEQRDALLLAFFQGLSHQEIATCLRTPLGTIKARIRRALPYVSPERLVAAPDCGMKYLPAESAFGKMKSLVAGAKIVRGELVGRAAAN